MTFISCRRGNCDSIREVRQHEFCEWTNHLESLWNHTPHRVQCFERIYAGYYPS